MMCVFFFHTLSIILIYENHILIKLKYDVLSKQNINIKPKNEHKLIILLHCGMVITCFFFPFFVFKE